MSNTINTADIAKAIENNLNGFLECYDKGIYQIEEYRAMVRATKDIASQIGISATFSSLNNVWSAK